MNIVEGRGQRPDPATAPPLVRLADELVRRGWRAELAGDELYVRNPQVPDLNDIVTYDRGAFIWSWGEPIDRAGHVEKAASQILHVLREADS